MFIVKYAPSGNVVWAKTIGDVDGEIGHGIATDANGNVYVTGCFPAHRLLSEEPR
jgi:hypothetical protein